MTIEAQNQRPPAVAAAAKVRKHQDERRPRHRQEVKERRARPSMREGCRRHGLEEYSIRSGARNVCGICMRERSAKARERARTKPTYTLTFWRGRFRGVAFADDGDHVSLINRYGIEERLPRCLWLVTTPGDVPAYDIRPEPGIDVEMITPAEMIERAKTTRSNRKTGKGRRL